MLKYEQTKGIYNNSAWCFVNSAIQFLYSCDEIRNYILNTNIEIIKENYELNTKDEEKKIKINKLKLKNLKFIFEKLNNSENTDEYLSDTLILEEKKQLVKNLPDIKCNGKTINMGTSWEIVKHFLDILQNNIQKIEEIFIDWHYENDILKVNYQEHFVTPFIQIGRAHV